jgi:hypothetical protein
VKKTIAIVSAAAVAIASLGAALPANAAAPTGGQFINVAMHSGDHNPPPTFERHGDYAMYNGHRGDRHFHRGWRLYNGYYFPPAAFVGLAIGAAVTGGIIHAITHH